MPDYNLGGTVRLDDPKTLARLTALYEEEAIHHVQVQAVLLPQPLFREHLDRIAAAGIPAVIHAPHHGHGVNPCAPAAYDNRPIKEIEAYVEEAMSQTLEAADVLGAETIVLHAGRYEPGADAAARETFAGFLDRHSDPRFALENLPAVYAGYPLLGNTAKDLTALAGETITHFCLDFPHLACTTNYRGLSFTEELERFDALNVTHHHLSNIRRGSITDEHLELDHPEGGLDLNAVVSRLRRHPAVPTTLEYKEDSPEVYARQARVFAGLWEGHARGGRD
ncbi:MULTISPECIES: TIM barrel protein [Methanoculleus]|jgi:sugar phosphate isomerase/epimerase|uniref:Sugar phosphate isomerase/epimerase n=1 Tax=Methanoculleus thermophilus TaxID=2200 RepID=A0A1G8ZHY0_9EURY|nr:MULTISPECIES: TIM barrel protein [Methanoculleus]SDK14613.1 Sugar phosphate isomerase/epimerase [Methanoculleus thermophilus]